MITYKKALKDAQDELEKKGISEQTAFLYLLEISNKEAHNLYMEFEEKIPSDLYKEFQNGVNRLKNQEPLAHILGYEWFYGYQFQVNEDVLIPRPETEELLANILVAYDERFADKEDVVAIDIGTGSGAIAISLKKEEPKIQVIASDISEKAILVAKENAIKNDADVTFLVGDMVEPFIDAGIKVDILISNPPYIPKEESLEESVKGFEPHIALFGGEDGLKFYRTIFERAPLVLNKGAIMAFEIGYNLKVALSKEALSYFPDAKIEVLTDINNKDRMLFIYM